MAADIIVLYYTFTATWSIVKAGSEVGVKTTLPSALLQNGMLDVPHITPSSNRLTRVS